MNKKVCVLIFCIIPVFFLAQESEVMKSREELLHDYVLMYPQLDEGFDIIHNIYKSDPTFYQFLDTHVPENSESNLDSLEKIHDISMFGDVIYQAEDYIITYMKPRFLKEISYMMNDSSPKIDDSSNPAFRYVMKHSHGFMKLVVAKWVNGKDLFKPDHEILTTEVSRLERYEMRGNEDISADRTITFKKLAKYTNKQESLLSKAVKKNNKKMFLCLVDLEADINDYYGMFEYPLHDAVLYSLDIVVSLLALKANCNVQNGKGETPLWQAVLLNKIDVVQLLLSAGSDPNLADNVGFSPLHVAANHNRFHVIDMLLNAGANINIKNQGGQTPLILAGFFNNIEAAKKLVERGADISLIDNKNRTALTMSATRQMKNIIINRGNQSACVVS